MTGGGEDRQEHWQAWAYTKRSPKEDRSKYFAGRSPESKDCNIWQVQKDDVAMVTRGFTGNREPIAYRIQKKFDHTTSREGCPRVKIVIYDRYERMMSPRSPSTRRAKPQQTQHNAAIRSLAHHHSHEAYLRHVRDPSQGRSPGVRNARLTELLPNFLTMH